ncbi:tRNA (N6-isopentenyl adenosine(37)-C2)-methylthiotransferase MiaB [Candidatus Peregrinibacteria bacterium]|nr:MAG: tRNA (N6-isopentenyl adenosine(37)-C2)-methylthiotransferase MiaB [Candidatus Peregrinibacteria bacterium]
MKYCIRTFGCQMNYSDSERMTTVLEKMKYQKAEDFADSDLVILNTCSIKQPSEDRVIGLEKQFRPLRLQNPNLRIGITGCMVRETGIRGQSNDRLFKQMKSIDFVFQIKELMKLPDILHELHPIESDEEVSDLLSYFHISPKLTNATQVFCPIQRGCNNYCSFCIVPYSRGKEVCREMSEMEEEIKKFVKRGASEINLVGQNVNSYKPTDFDKNSIDSPFAQLLRKIDAIEGVKRIRFYAVHPKDMGDDVVNLYGELKSMVPHIHLPLQSGSASCLKRMNRRYEPDKFRELVHKLRARVPHISISTDIIVGFCGETEAEHQETVDLMKELKIDLAYISKYSERPGTLAQRSLKDDVSLETKKRRFREMTDVIRDISNDYHQQFVGQTKEVLVEKVEKGYASGKIPEFKLTRFESDDKELIGKYVPVTITEALDWCLEAKLSIS